MTTVPSRLTLGSFQNSEAPGADASAFDPSSIPLGGPYPETRRFS